MFVVGHAVGVEASHISLNLAVERVENVVPAQVSMIGVLSILVTTGLVVIISLDHPFTGPIHIRPEPLAAVLADFKQP